jgi:hypothetical protein
MRDHGHVGIAIRLTNSSQAVCVAKILMKVRTTLVLLNSMAYRYSSVASGIFICLLCGESYRSDEERTKHQNEDHKDARIRKSSSFPNGFFFNTESAVQ